MDEAVATTEQHVLLPELFQRVAEYIMTSKDMLSFLRALPTAWLSAPLRALLSLYGAVRSRRLVVPVGDPLYPNHVRLWPEFLMPTTLADAELQRWVEMAAGLHPIVCLDTVHNATPTYEMPPTTKLKLLEIATPSQLKAALETWGRRVASIELDFADDHDNEDEVDVWTQANLDRFCYALTILPVLREVDMIWHYAATHKQQLALMQALGASQVTNLVIEYVNSRVEWTKPTVLAFAAWLAHRPVEFIKLDGLWLNEECLKILCDAFCASTTLKELDLRFGSLPTGLFYARSTLPPQLQSLGMEVCSYNDLPVIIGTLRGANILGLNLSFEEEIPEEIEQSVAFVEALTRLSKLRRLELTPFVVPPPALPHLATLLPQLLYLDLEASNLMDEGVLAIAHVLPSCPRLEALRLVDQDCTYLSAIALAAVIPRCKALKVLDLPGNRIGSIGAHALATIFHRLDAVDISDNWIGFDGAMALSRVIPETCHMETMGLHDNPFGIDGALAIISALEACTYREGKVHIGDTVETPEELEECRTAAQRLPDLAWLCLERHDNEEEQHHD
ncbi:hypothetical protein SPRG_15117 [Saprolegnia parasitica CBS 223.65]|uniref:Uncharacterized protein n=1 Tax=Saprolegnia parasitica (strain CBS 223.65) TaxID=695850 RepID=A0A067BM34_SAPPC|nr:hypothetical protein SPRG_15117 [Saprolegnia parasitica CBS 223.65]KDO19243.1 hypothetical protein SPRG_15117 [Saprolegnia parasitica CBS 223.65]|eukprot:XP_012210048.1 hypothetical protein SPRG_15117 [Saprolegnia parasitica CBS 223.65]